jgi:uncharacterized damage-inducible protein DinB
METADIRYPIGKFSPQQTLTTSERAVCIEQIAESPSKLRATVSGLSESQIDTPYRDGGWTVRQIVHHLPDSHMNAYIRFKLAVTEQNPTIKPYEQQLWAELSDARTSPIEHSFALLESLHQRWVAFLQSLQKSDFAKRFIHPESGEHDLDWLLQMYAWHGRHHTAQITECRKRMKW